MNWMTALIDVYDCNYGGDHLYDKTPLLPIGHATNEAGVTIFLRKDGTFIRAELVEKGAGRSIMPCRIMSPLRDGNPNPYPLCDKIQYLTDRTEKPHPKNENLEKYYDAYLRCINGWADDENHSHPSVKAVRDYISRNTLADDLAGAGVATLIDGMIPEKSDEGVMLGTFVRFKVDGKAVWEDESLFQSWIDYYLALLETNDIEPAHKGVDYITGEPAMTTKYHSTKLRHTGDRTRLLSSNGDDGEKYINYRGRFETADQACSIGYISSQKLHNALRWLISENGRRVGNYVFVSWTNHGKSSVGDICTDEDYTIGTEDSKRLANRMTGYDTEITDDMVHILALDASGDQGRLSVVAYYEFLPEEYKARMDRWYKAGEWIHKYWVDGEDGKRVCKTGFGMPSPRTITKTLYGDRVSDTQAAMCIRRIVDAMLAGRPMPRDIVESLARKVANPHSFKDKSAWEEAVRVSCSCTNNFKYYNTVDCTEE